MSRRRRHGRKGGRASSTPSKRRYRSTHSNAGAGRRSDHVPRVVAEALAAHIAEYPPAEDGSLFTTPTDMPYRHEHYGSRIFAKAVRAARLPTGTTSHHLRHHFTSVLLAAGESVVAVAERLGHENATQVLKTYGHLMPDSEDRTRRAIDAAWTTDGLETASANG
jgi:integrase